MSRGANNRLVEAAKTGDLYLLRQSLEEGADIDNLDSGYSALLWAAHNEKPAAVQFLIEKGASPDARTAQNGWAPLMSAITKNNAEIAQMLMQAGADPHIRNSKGQTLAEIARENGHSDSLVQQLPSMAKKNPMQVSFTQKLEDVVMQEIFNFETKERITLIRKREYGDVSAMQRDSFFDLTDKSGLRRAFAEHVKRGGTLREDEIFNDAIPKTKLSKPAALQP